MFATKVFAYITLAPAIIPPAPVPAVIVLATKLFVVSVVLALSKVRAALAPKEPESLNWIYLLSTAVWVVRIEPKALAAVL